MTTALVLFGVAIVISNLFALRDGFNVMRDEGGYVKADLGALSLARAKTPPSLRLTEGIAHDEHLTGVTAGRYFAETRAQGSPVVYTAAQISNAPAPQRAAADRVLASAYAIAPKTQPAAKTTGCARLPIGARTVSELQLPRGGAVVINRTNGPLVIGVRRFAPHGRPSYVGLLAGRSAARLAIPNDRATAPWHLVVLDPRPTAAALDVCPPAQ